MTWQTILYFSSILLTCVLTGFLAWYAWKHRQVPAARAYMRLTLSECFFALAEIFSVLSPSSTTALFWFQARYLAGAFMSVFWLVFALEYSGHKEWLSKRLLAGLFIIPFVTQVLLWSNSLHGVWMKQEAGFTQNGIFRIADVTTRIPGLGYLTHSFYTLLLTLAGIALMLLTAWRMRRELLGQAVMLAGAGLTAFTFAMNSLFNFLPKTGFNPFTPGIGLSVFLIALSVFRFEFLKRAPAQESDSHTKRLDAQEKYSLAVFILIFILLASSIAAASYFTYQNYERHFHAQVENQLSAISALKVDNLQDWRNERLADARLFYQNDNFSERVRKVLEDPQDAEARINLLTWMEKVQASPEYDRIFLLDVQGVERISIPAAPEAVPQNLVEQASASLESDQIIFLDFHRHSDSDAIHLSMVVPIFDAQKNQPLGVLVLRINPEVYLYPFIQRWPVPSQSAETLLVRRDGNDILYLNELKFEEDAALNLRIPMENEDTPAVKAALGFEGIVTGVDYRGEQVIADIRAVPNSPWFVISKMDTAEVDAPLRDRLWQTLFFFGVLILITGAGLLLVWREQRIRFYRGQVDAAEALHASEEKFRLAFDTSPDSVSITRMSDGMFVSVNKGFEQLSGYTREHVLGKTSAEINIWKDPADRRNVVEALQATGKIQNYEAPFLALDAEIYGLMSAVIIEINGEPHILNIVRDITERKLAEKALYESEDRFRRLAENAQDLIYRYELSPKRGFSYVSPAAMTITGYSPEEHYADPDLGFKLVHPDDQHLLVETTQGGDAIRTPLVLRWIRKDGSMLWTEQRNVPIYAEDGTLVALEGIAIDITQRRQADEKLRESENRYRLISENSADVIWTLDLASQKFTYVSPSVFNLRGLTPEEVMAEPMQASMTPASFQVVSENLPADIAAFMAGDLSARIRTTFIDQVRKDGSIVPTEVVTNLVTDSQGRVVEVLGVTRDITERKQAEESLLKSETNLSALIENTDGSIWAVDNQYGLIVGNREFHHNISAAIGRRLEMGESVLLPIFPPEVNAEWQGLYDRALQGESFTFETVTHFREEPHYIEYYFSPIREDDGEIRGVTVYGRDITERRKSEKEIRFKDELLRMTSEMAQIGGWEFDALTQEGTWTDEVAYIHDLEPDQPTNVTLGSSFYLPDSRRKIELAIQQALESAQPYDLELKMISAKGNEKWVRTIGHPIVVDGKVIKIQGIFQEITERKLAEDALRETNEYLENLINYANAPIIVWDPQFKITRFNHAFEILTGRSAADMLGKQLEILFPPALVQSSMQLIQNTQSGEHWEVVEISIQHVDGSIHAVLWNSATLFSSDGTTPVATIAQGQDITQRKQAEEKLQENILRLELAMQSANMAWWEMNISTGDITFSERKAKMLGYPPEQFKHYSDFMALVHPEDSDKTMNAMQRHIDGISDKYKVEYRISTKSEGYKWYYDLGSIVKRDSNGRPLNATGLVIDITERKQAEEELIVSETRYRRLFEAARDGILILDAETGIIVDANPFLIEMLGFPLEGFVGKELWELGFFKDIAANKDNFLELKQKEYIRYENLPLETSDGRKFHVEFVSNVYQVNDRKVIQCNIRDITDRVLAEESLTTSETRYRRLFEAARDGILIVDAESGMILDVNPFLVELLGFSQETFLHKALWELGFFKDIAANKTNFLELQQKEHIKYEGLPLETADGKKIQVEFVSHVYQVDEHKMIQCNIRDITDRKQAEEKLKEVNQDLKQAQSVAHLGNWKWNLKTSSVEWSDEMFNIFGIDKDSYSGRLGEVIAKVIHPDDLHIVLPSNASEFAKNKPQEYRIIRPTDGEIRHIWAQVGASILDEQGNPAFLTGIAQDITERKQAEEKIKENARILRIAGEKAKLGGWSVDLRSNLCTWSDQTAAIHERAAGYLPLVEEGISYYAPEWHEKITKVFTECAQNGIPYDEEMEIITANGKRVWVRTIGEPVKDEAGKIIKVQGAFQDITERKQMEEALRESETFIKTVLNNLPVGVAVNSVEPTVAFNYMNDNFAKFYRTTKEKLADPNTFWDAAYEEPDFRETMRKRILDDLASSDPERMSWVDIPVTRKGEATTFITARNIPIPNQPLMISTVWDVTERKQAEDKLAASEVRYRRLFEATRDGILILDAETGMVVDVNPFLIELLGYSHEVFLGKKLWEMGFFKDIAASKEKFLELQHQEYIRYEDLPLETADGRRINVEFTSNVYHTDHQKVIQCNIRDLTERKQAQEQLHKTLEELKRSNIELEQFAYIASHDLQEPLRAVAGMVQLLQKRYEGQLDTRADEYINLAMDGATRMQTLITDLLTYSRVERRGNPMQPVDANKSLTSALRNLQVSIAEQGATVTSETLPTLEADASQLTQLFQNLIGNAIKFHGEHPTLVHVGVEKLENAWHFSVCDNGIGIDPQYFERIFLVFQRLHTRREYSGTGIGLSICKKIVERHGGRIWIESQPGQGTTFHFTIPFRS